MPIVDDLPNRSVFPSKNPIMLRVPTKSTLRPLEKQSVNLAALQRLKEKYRIVLSKQVISSKPEQTNQNPGSPKKNLDDNIQENLKSNKKGSKDDLDPHLAVHSNFPQGLVSNKSSGKVISKYAFNEDSNLSPLKNLRRSKKPYSKPATNVLQSALLGEEAFNFESRTYGTIIDKAVIDSNSLNTQNQKRSPRKSPTNECILNEFKKENHFKFDNQNASENLGEIDQAKSLAKDKPNGNLRRKLCELPLNTFNEEISVSPAKMQKLIDHDLQNISPPEKWNKSRYCRDSSSSEDFDKFAKINSNLNQKLNLDISNRANSFSNISNFCSPNQLINCRKPNESNDDFFLTSTTQINENEALSDVEDLSSNSDELPKSEFLLSSPIYPVIKSRFGRNAKLPCSPIEITSVKSSPGQFHLKSIRKSAKSRKSSNFSQSVVKIPIVCTKKSKPTFLSVGVKQKEVLSELASLENRINVKNPDPSSRIKNFKIKTDFRKDSCKEISITVDKSLQVGVVETTNDSNSLSSKNFDHKNNDVDLSIDQNVNSEQKNNLNQREIYPISEEISQNEKAEKDIKFVSMGQIEKGCAVLPEESNDEKICRWIQQVDEETKRVSYVDTITGNSSFITPGLLLENSESQCQDIDIKGDDEKHHFFLTHDFSPFVKKTLLNEELKAPSDITALQSNLNDYMIEKDKIEKNSKWHDSEEKEGNEIQDLFGEWENPMFEVSSEALLDENLKASSFVPQAYMINSYRFTKSTLKTLKVIGQVDCKFIACILENFNQDAKDQRLLAMFDQHAVHERIRLEELLDDLYKELENGKRVVKSSEISPPLEITLDLEEVRLLKAYYVRLEEIGIFLEVKGDTKVKVHSIPSCLVDLNTHQLKRQLSEVLLVIEKSIKEWLTSLSQCRSVSTILPKSLSSVLNAQACRGAVKFGDPLTFSDCARLLSSLSNCKLPFQCAHGRPSITPILDLNKIDCLSKKESLLSLDKLKERAAISYEI